MLVGARFFAPIQTGSEAHPVSYAVGTGSFRGVRRPGRGVDLPSLSNAEVKDTVKLSLAFSLSLCLSLSVCLSLSFYVYVLYTLPLWVFVACFGLKFNKRLIV
jgi:hypothetical protein